jgi:hypothetical protein
MLTAKDLDRIHLCSQDHIITIRLNPHKEIKLDQKRLAMIPVEQEYTCYLEFKEQCRFEPLDLYGTGTIVPLLSMPGVEIIKVIL